MIELQSVFKEYVSAGESFFALRDVSFSIRENDYIAITGQSGSGKSTLMNILGCLDVPSKGSYYLNGSLISGCDESELARIRNQEIGFIFQSFNLIPNISVLDNVIQPLVYRSVSKSNRIEMARSALVDVGLVDKILSRPNELSGGQRQRVAIARALV